MDDASELSQVADRRFSKPIIAITRRSRSIYHIRGIYACDGISGLNQPRNV